MHWKDLLPEDVFCSISVKVDDVVTIWNKKNLLHKTSRSFHSYELGSTCISVMFLSS